MYTASLELIFSAVGPHVCFHASRTRGFVQIWFRKFLKIPLPESNTVVSPDKVPDLIQPEREQGALQAQRISALKKLCPRLTALGARQLLEASDWDLWRANMFGEWLFRLSGEVDIDWREALAYLEMYLYDMDKAERVSRHIFMPNISE